MSRMIVTALGLVVLGASAVLTCGESTGRASTKAAPKIPRKLLEERLDAARRVFEMDFKRLQAAEMTPGDRLMWWSERWLNAQLALSETENDRTTAHESHVKRLKELEQIFVAYAKAGQGRASDADAATYFRANAEVLLLEAGGK